MAAHSATMPRISGRHSSASAARSDATTGSSGWWARSAHSSGCFYATEPSPCSTWLASGSPFEMDLQQGRIADHVHQEADGDLILVAEAAARDRPALFGRAGIIDGGPHDLLGQGLCRRFRHAKTAYSCLTGILMVICRRHISKAPVDRGIIPQVLHWQAARRVAQRIAMRVRWTAQSQP